MALREDLLPLWEIFEEHLDEATFLWARRERCLVSPLYNLSETGQEEERLVAHLEELAEGGAQVSQRLVVPALEGDEPERISAATYSLLVEQGRGACARIVTALEEGDDARRTAIQRALELWDGPERAECLKPLWTSETPDLQLLALEVSTFHGEELDASVLAPLLGNDDIRTRLAALHSARWLPGPLRTTCASAALAAREPAVRMVGVELGLECGMRKAWEVCHEIARSSVAERAWAWVLLAACGGAKDLEPVLRELNGPARHHALWALGFSGRVAAADACLEAMRGQPAAVAALAAEAFSAVTGLPIEGPYAGKPPPEDESLPPLEEEDLEADLVPKPEADLPTPEVQAIEQWWEQARKRFDPAARYLRGQPFTGPALLLGLEQEPMRRRHVLARMLAIYSRGAIQLQTRSRAVRQRGVLKAASGSGRSLSVKLFDS